jgi:hypothetical protein
MLTSFIEAHENAQKKIHGFLSFENDENYNSQIVHTNLSIDSDNSSNTNNNVNNNNNNNILLKITPEETQVIFESKNAVFYFTFLYYI